MMPHWRKHLACMLACLGPIAAFAQQAPSFPLPPAEWPKPVDDRQSFGFLFVDRLEYAARSGPDVFLWDVQGWLGSDYNKLWLKPEGEKTVGGNTEHASVDVLYARRILPFWYLQAGVRAEERPGPRRNFGAIGVQGIAPRWFNVEASAYVGRDGELQARLEAENELYFTQRLVLEPRVETLISTRGDPERGLGRGVRRLEAGLRLRYEIRREIAPYIGVTLERAYGETADFMRQQGENPLRKSIVAGVRIWY